jgi:Mg-chelatase subunit ChlD
MSEIFAHFHFSQPWILLLALLAPLFWLRRRGRSLPVILWRSVVFVLLVFVLAGPELVRETSVAEREERIFVFDFSRSVPPSARAAMARAARENFSLSSQDRIIVFAGKSVEVDDLEPWIRGEISPAAIQPEQTNLQELFASLLEPAGAARKLYLFTDGWETQGDLERLLPSFRPANLKVFPVVPAQYDTPNVAVKKVVAPHQGTSGESVPLRVIVENYNSKPVEGTLVVKRNGQPFKNDSITLKPGSQIFTFQTALTNETFVSFEASFSARAGAGDLFPQDNHATAWIAVQSKEKVLLLNGQAGGGRYLEELLRRRGFEVTSVTAGEPPPPPAGYRLVIFNNAEREKFSSAYLSAIERHTAAGNAFLMLGGDRSFGFEGYKKTPIEATLPVEIKEPPKKQEKKRAVILVIDKSGSMREDNRILYAREAAKSLIRQLRDSDLIGVTAFDISAFVVVPLSQVGRVRESFSSDIERLKPGGRTYILPGLVEAKRQLERQTADTKHVIILSDGETAGAQGDYIDLADIMRRESKITVSAVAVGNDANIPLLKRIAQYGGGFFHHTYDPRSLPQIVSQQLQEKPEEEPPPDERPLAPVQVRGSEILNGFSERSYPPVRSYVETDLKKGAHLDLMIAQQQKRNPLLASWKYGNGKAVAFTTDLQGGGTRDWIRWSELEKFWNSIFNWLRPIKENVLPPHEIRINVAEDRPVLDLYLYAQESAESVFRFSYSGKGHRGEGALKKLAAGHYQTVLPFATPGDYRIELTEDKRGQKGAYPPLGYTLAFNPRAEIPRGYVNLRLLEKLAHASGGEINPDKQLAASRENVSRTVRPLRSPLILLIAVLFLLEVFMRRFVLGLPVSP